MHIDVFADIWCPFAHVGLRAVAEQRRLAGRTDVGIIVRAWPLELVNGAPMDPAGARHHADELCEQVAPDMFTHMDVDHFPTSTLEALALVERAYRVDVATGERASFALRDELFERGRDISRHDVLVSVASSLGLGMPDGADRAAVLTDWEEGRRRGVLGSPHFFCGETDVFCPSLTISKVPDEGLSIQRDTSRLVAFVEQCLAHADQRPTNGG
jgi:predicted DsbA family dithiol-disulfide isomerase